MVDKQNGQSIAQAEAQVLDIESQIASRERFLITQESQIRGSFIPGTIESQFRFGSGQALSEARKGFRVEKEKGLSQIFSQRGDLGDIRGQVAERKSEIAIAKSAQAAQQAKIREQEDRIRKAKVQRKTDLKAFERRRQKAIDKGEIQSSIPKISLEARKFASAVDIGAGITSSTFAFAQAADITKGFVGVITPKTSSRRGAIEVFVDVRDAPIIDQGTIAPSGAVGSAIGGGFLVQQPGGEVTVVRPPTLGTFQSFPLTPLPSQKPRSQLPAFQPSPLQSFASPTDLGITPDTTPASFSTPQGSFNPPSKTGGLLTVSEREAKDFRQPFESFSATQRPTGRAEGLLFDIQEARGPLTTATLRGQATFGQQVSSFGLGGAETVIAGGIGIARAFTSPIETITALPGAPRALRSRAVQFGETLRTDPALAFGQVVGEVALFKGTGVVARGIGKGAEIGITRLDPRFVPTTETGIRGIPTGTGTLDLPFAGPVSQISVPLSEQAGLAGREATIVSAQTSFFPILPRAQTLTREFFADPSGRIRISRFGFQEQRGASALDIVSGDFTFLRGRPQISVTQAQIQPFPSSLADVRGTLLGGGQLSSSQARRLSEFQATPSGQFKPIGFLSTEPEVTLPAGQIIGSGRTLGVTLIQGRRVRIVEPTIRGAPKIDLGIDITGTGRGRGPSLSSQLEIKPFVSPTSLGIPTTSFLPSPSRQFSLSPSSRVGGLSISSQFAPISRGRSGASSLGGISSLAPSGFSSGGFPGGSSLGSPITGISTGIPGIPSIIAPPRITEPPIRKPPIKRKTADQKKGKKKVTKRKTRVGKVAPSFTAQALDVRGIFPRVDPRIGISPFSIRALPTGRKKKRTRKKR